MLVPRLPDHGSAIDLAFDLVHMSRDRLQDRVIGARLSHKLRFLDSVMGLWRRWYGQEDYRGRCSADLGGKDMIEQGEVPFVPLYDGCAGFAPVPPIAGLECRLNESGMRSSNINRAMKLSGAGEDHLHHCA
jgi:hypothetical protein